MSVDIYEMAFKRHLTIEEVKAGFIQCCGVRRFVSREQYWDLSLDRLPDAIGIDVSWREVGFQTRVWFLSARDFYADNLLGIVASCLTSSCKSDVLIGEFDTSKGDVTDMYRVYCENGDIYRAFEGPNDDIEFSGLI